MAGKDCSGQPRNQLPGKLMVMFVMRLDPEPGRRRAETAASRERSNRPRPAIVGSGGLEGFPSPVRKQGD
jgi:hypothetical protein